MQRYVFVSSLFLTLLACVQLIRLLLRWSVTVDGVAVPLWASALAALIAGSLAIWAFKVNGRGSSSTAV